MSDSLQVCSRTWSNHSWQMTTSVLYSSFQNEKSGKCHFHFVSHSHSSYSSCEHQMLQLFEGFCHTWGAMHLDFYSLASTLQIYYAFSTLKWCVPFSLYWVSLSIHRVILLHWTYALYIWQVFAFCSRQFFFFWAYRLTAEVWFDSNLGRDGVLPPLLSLNFALHHWTKQQRMPRAHCLAVFYEARRSDPQMGPLWQGID